MQLIAAHVLDVRFDAGHYLFHEGEQANDFSTCSTNIISYSCAGPKNSNSIVPLPFQG